MAGSSAGALRTCVVLMIVGVALGGMAGGKGQGPAGKAAIPKWALPLPDFGNSAGELKAPPTFAKGPTGSIQSKTEVTYYHLNGIPYRVEKKTWEIIMGHQIDPPQVKVVEIPTPKPVVGKTREILAPTECFNERPGQIESLVGQDLWGAEGPTAADVVQGALGNCWFLSSLMSIVSAPPPLGAQFIQEHTRLGKHKKKVRVNMWDGAESLNDNGARVCTPATITVPYTRSNFALKTREGKSLRLGYHTQNWVFMWMKALGVYKKSAAAIPSIRDELEPSLNSDARFSIRRAGLALPPPSNGQDVTCTADLSSSDAGSPALAFRMILGPDWTVHTINTDTSPDMRRVQRILEWASEARNPMAIGSSDAAQTQCDRYGMDGQKQQKEQAGQMNNIKMLGNHAYGFVGVRTVESKAYVLLRDPYGTRHLNTAEFLMPISDISRCVRSISFVDTEQFIAAGGAELAAWRKHGLDQFM